MVLPSLLIGIDAASRPENSGYAIARLCNNRLSLEEYGLLSSRQEPHALANRIAPLVRHEAALVAIDAPLGWPGPLGEQLVHHRAGQVVPVGKDQLFRRETDRFIHRDLGKLPLEVGADKIARAAHAALEVLDELRTRTGRPIPLLWDHSVPAAGAIEVYPAATLIARGISSSGYKKPENPEPRHTIARALNDELPELAGLVDEPIDVFDACLCLLAGKDFLDGLAMPPVDRALAEREGWIWVRRPVARC